MTTSIRRPERRNRKVGTPASGHGQDNKMSIPLSRIDRFGNSSEFYDRMQIDDISEFKDDKRHNVLSITETPLRNTLLYRTFLHELGHLKQFKVEVPVEETALANNSDLAWKHYHAKPQIEREQFANRYADDTAKKLQKSGHIPFEPINFKL